MPQSVLLVPVSAAGITIAAMTGTMEGPGGAKLECACEGGRVGVCFDPGP